MKILIVDDSRVSRRIVQKELESGGYQTEEAVDGAEAIKILMTDPGFSLVTLDVSMPRLNGYQVCSILRRRELYGKFPHEGTGMMPIIFVTGDDTLDGRIDGFEAGATEFVVKGFRKGDLLRVVDRILKPHLRMAGLKVLVVEDHDIVRKIICSCLKGFGVSIVEATNGVDAFNLLKEQGGFDMVVTDMDMPKMNGKDLCRKIRRDLGLTELPVIVICGFQDRSLFFELYKEGASDCLVKPLVREELFARLAVFLEVILLHREQRMKIEELKNLNKLKDDFLSVCSHDLKTPLTSILGVSRLLVNDQTLEEKHRQLIGMVENSGNFLLTLIDDLLDLVQMQMEEQELHKEILDIEELAGQVIENASLIASAKNITLTLNSEINRSEILGDKTAMERILNNLLSNAVKFTADGGTVAMDLSHTQNQEIRLSIQDNGIGMPDEMIDHLFDKYVKTSRRGTGGEKGTGLGLPIVKDLVEKHDGTISVQSTEGKGTCFTLIIPEAHDES